MADEKGRKVEKQMALEKHRGLLYYHIEAETLTLYILAASHELRAASTGPATRLFVARGS